MESSHSSLLVNLTLDKKKTKVHYFYHIRTTTSHSLFFSLYVNLGNQKI